MAERSIQIVFSNPYPGKDDEFNEWYDNTHVPDILKIPGILSAQRYDLRQLQREKDAGKEPDYRYVTIYEIEGDVDEVMAAISTAATSGQMMMSDAFDRTTAKLAFWTAHGSKQVSQ